MIRKILTLAIVVSITAVLGACSSTSRSGRIYSQRDALHPMKVTYGTVTASHSAQIEGEQTGLGRLAGSALGATLGYGAGGGNFQAAAAAAGVVAGLIISPWVEERLNRKSALEIEIHLDDGRIIMVLQEDDISFKQGDRVRVIRNGGGELRIRHMRGKMGEDTV